VAGAPVGCLAIGVPAADTPGKERSIEIESETDSDSSVEQARWGPLATALSAFQAGRHDATIIVRSDLGTYEEWPAALFFREPDEFTQLEREALDLCGRRVIDVGAGAGPHTLALLRRGHDVLAVESHPAIAALLRDRGVPRVTIRPLDELPTGRADTVLMMMNGFGLAGTLEGLVPLLEAARLLLAPGGRILADSTDPRHWLETDDASVDSLRQDGRYSGEVQFQIEFDGKRGDPFSFLYVDPESLQESCIVAGLRLEEVRSFEDGTYLAILAATEDPPA